ncbi:MAG: hypothetical protein ACFCUO_00080 [Rhodospirillales bacterium]
MTARDPIGGDGVPARPAEVRSPRAARDRPATFWILVATAVVGPLSSVAGSAAVEAAAGALTALVVGGLLAAWGAEVVLGRDRPAFGLKRTWPLVVPFAAAAAWAAVQALPMTPAAWQHPLWASAAEALGPTPAAAISLAPHQTLTALMRLLACGGIFWLALQHGRRSDRARQIFTAVAYAGLAFALYGLVARVSGAPPLFATAPFAGGDGVGGAFDARNADAAHTGLALLCSTGLIMVALGRGIDGAVGGGERLLRLTDGVGMRQGLLLASWITLMAALILGSSREGFLVTILGVALLVLLLGLVRTVPARFALAFGLACAVAAATFSGIGGDRTAAATAAAGVAGSQRADIERLTRAAIGTAPLLGTGYDTFEEVFRFHRSAGLGPVRLEDRAVHLEVALELGIPAAAMLVAVFGGLLMITATGVRRRGRDVVYPAIGLTATATVAAHAVVGVSVQVPAVAVVYCLIMGAACAQSWSSRAPDDPW